MKCKIHPVVRIISKCLKDKRKLFRYLTFQEPIENLKHLILSRFLENKFGHFDKFL